MEKEFIISSLYKNLRSCFLAGLLVAFTLQAGAQHNLGLDANSFSVGGFGPSIEPQVGTFQVSTANGDVSSDISVTASFESQSFTNVPGSGTGTGLQFGAAQNTSGSSVAGQNTWAVMENVSSPSNSQFSLTSNLSEAVDVSTNYAFSIFSTTRPLAVNGMSTNGRFLMGRLTLSFIKPVDNPILHIVGLGGTVGELGITSELELVNPNITAGKLRGNDNLNVTGNQILNGAANPDASSYTGAASGSVQVTGSNVTKLSFNVYMKGDGGTANWEKDNQYNGDRWLIGVSVDGANAPKNPVAALPIYITDFNVIHDAPCTAKLHWKTNTELGMSDFFVEHSTDGITFDVLYSFPSAGAAEGHYYNYTYPYAINGANFFRIRTKDILAEYNYGAIVKVLVSCKDNPVEIFPNPAQDYLHLHGVANGQVVRLSNMFGKVMRTNRLTGIDGSVDLNGLQPGIYVLSISGEHGEEVYRTRINKQ